MVWSIKTTDSNIQVLHNFEPSLKQMQEAVGGYIEFVYLSNGQAMVVNEEGLLKRLPLNRIASTLANQDIVGNVLVFSKDEMEKME